MLQAGWMQDIMSLQARGLRITVVHYKATVFELPNTQNCSLLGWQMR